MARVVAGAPCSRFLLPHFSLASHPGRRGPATRSGARIVSVEENRPDANQIKSQARIDTTFHSCDTRWPRWRQESGSAGSAMGFQEWPAACAWGPRAGAL